MQGPGFAMPCHFHPFQDKACHNFDSSVGKLRDWLYSYFSLFKWSLTPFSAKLIIINAAILHYQNFSDFSFSITPSHNFALLAWV